MTDDETRCLGVFMDGSECERMKQCQRYLLRNDLGPNTATMWAVCICNDGTFRHQVQVEAK